MALQFFLFDSLKIIILLAVIAFVVTFIRTYLPPQQIKAVLTRRWPILGHLLAAIIGIITPFCSCSAIPLFLGLVESGVPLGVAFSYIVSAPMVNEVAAVLLLSLFGWRVMVLYVVTGVVLAVFTGMIINRLHLEYLLIRPPDVTTASGAVTNPDLQMRLRRSWRYTRKLVRRVTPFILLGVGVGAFIHNYAPQDFLARVAGEGNPLAVPVAVMLGVPLYANAAGTIPIVHALLGKGLPLGTSLAFMMSVTALSVPEMIILRRVMQPRLLAAYVGILTIGIILTGYLFNAVL